MKDDLKRAQQEATDLRGNRGWRDVEGPDASERKALRRKARRKLRQASRSDARAALEEEP